MNSPPSLRSSERSGRSRGLTLGMGIKNFHVFFIAISVLLAAGFGLWCFLTEAGRAAPGSTALGTIAFIAAVALLIYGRRFLRKIEEEDL